VEDMDMLEVEDINMLEEHDHPSTAVGGGYEYGGGQGYGYGVGAPVKSMAGGWGYKYGGGATGGGGYWYGGGYDNECGGGWKIARGRDVDKVLNRRWRGEVSTNSPGMERAYEVGMFWRSYHI
jgi:hypothetical protein